jgi:hypothetical protein
MCRYGNDPKNDVDVGVSDKVLEVMKQNMVKVPSLKYQFFGTQADGAMYFYPATNSCSRVYYDPRLR